MERPEDIKNQVKGASELHSGPVGGSGSLFSVHDELAMFSVYIDERLVYSVLV